MFRPLKKETLGKTADVVLDLKQQNLKFRPNEVDSPICYVIGCHQQVIIIH